jgi:hypothetical protein
MKQRASGLERSRVQRCTCWQAVWWWLQRCRYLQAGTGELVRMSLLWRVMELRSILCCWRPVAARLLQNSAFAAGVPLPSGGHRTVLELTLSSHGMACALSGE